MSTNTKVSIFMLKNKDFESKIKQKTCFLGFLAHLNFFPFSHPPLPPTRPIICCHPSLPPTTDAPHCRHPSWWVVAVVDAGGGRHQWWFVVVGGSSGCQRLAVVGCVCWQ